MESILNMKYSRIIGGFTVKYCGGDDSLPYEHYAVNCIVQSTIGELTCTYTVCITIDEGDANEIAKTLNEKWKGNEDEERPRARRRSLGYLHHRRNYRLRGEMYKPLRGNYGGRINRSN